MCIYEQWESSDEQFPVQTYYNEKEFQQVADLMFKVVDYWKYTDDPFTKDLLLHIIDTFDLILSVHENPPYD